MKTAGTVGNPELIQRERERIEDKQDVISDLVSDSIMNAKKHNAAYGRIIECCTEHAQDSLAANRLFKAIYFWTSCAVMVVLALVTCGVVLSHEEPAALISALTAFVTAFIVLPVTITKYLFNPDESRNLNELVKSIQEHDRKMTGK